MCIRDRKRKSGTELAYGRKLYRRRAYDRGRAVLSQRMAIAYRPKSRTSTCLCSPVCTSNAGSCR
eukprot:514732-Rhodomonas_salina.1